MKKSSNYLLKYEELEKSLKLQNEDRKEIIEKDRNLDLLKKEN